MKKIFMISLVLFAVSAAVFAASNSKEDKSVLTAVEEDFDFVYEVVNNTSGKLTVATFISNSSQKTVAKAEDVVIEKGESYQFKYKLDEIKAAFGKNLSLGSFYTPEGKWRCGGWEGNLNSKNKKFTATCKDAANPNYCLDIDSKWSSLK